MPSSWTCEPDARRRPTDLEADLPRAGVLDDVVERLLRDPVEDLLDGERQPLVERALDDDRQPDPTLERRGVGAQRAGQAVLLEVAGPELEDQRAHLGQRLALEVAELGELAARRIDVAVEQQLHRARDEGHREERLGHRIVELAGQVGALLAGCQLARLATQVALEPVALADIARRAVRPDEDGHRRSSRSR